MSPVTYKKYKNLCNEKGLINPINDSFISIPKALAILFPGIKLTHANFFRTKRNGAGTFRYFKQEIEFSFAEMNYRQQEKAYSRKKIIDDLSSNCTKSQLDGNCLKRYKRLLKKHNASDLDQLSRIVKRNSSIVTGKYHVSRILGCSSSTGSNRLRQWDREGRIKREIIQKAIYAPVNREGLEELRANVWEHTYIMFGGYLVSYGSQVTLLS